MGPNERSKSKRIDKESPLRRLFSNSTLHCSSTLFPSPPRSGPYSPDYPLLTSLPDMNTTHTSYHAILDSAFQEAGVRFDVSMLLESIVSTIELHELDCQRSSLMGRLRERNFQCTELESKVLHLQQVSSSPPFYSPLSFFCVFFSSSLAVVRTSSFFGRNSIKP